MWTASILLALNGLGSTVLAAHPTAYPPNATITIGTTSMFQLSSDSQFAFALMEWLALANGGGAATSKVLRAAAKIRPGYFESFYDEFNFLANSIHEQAVKAEKGKFLISAREALFRSSAYYRAADFFIHGNQSDPRIYSLWKQSLADFDRAVQLLPQPPTKVELKATNFTVPGYFYPATRDAPGHMDGLSSKRPAVIVGNGYDGSQQDSYHSYCAEVVQRGWHRITYEGPGQPTVRRNQDLGFIPQWWEAVTPVVDYLIGRDDVDCDRIVLAGFSFGGLLAPLAATHEHRLAAVLAIDGLVDMQAAMMEQFPPQLIDLYQGGNVTGFNLYIEKALSQSPGVVETQFRWIVEQGMFAFNTESPYEWFDGLGDFYLNQTKVDEILRPVFIASGEDDGGAPGQPEEVTRMFGDQAHYFLFKTNVGAGEHCSLGTEPQLAMRTLDWLAGIFDKAHNRT